MRSSTIFVTLALALSAAAAPQQVSGRGVEGGFRRAFGKAGDTQRGAQTKGQGAAKGAAAVSSYH